MLREVNVVEVPEGDIAAVLAIDVAVAELEDDVILVLVSVEELSAWRIATVCVP